MSSEQERAAILHTAVGIANEIGHSKGNKLDACHEVAKRVLGMFDTSIPCVANIPVDVMDNVVPITRRGTEVDNRLVSDYDIVRLRSQASAMAMFGHPEAA